MRSRRYSYENGTYERRCSQCSQWLPETTDHFYRSGDGFRSWCRSCWSGHARTVRADRRGTGRRFGLEIEFIGDPYAVEREMRARGLRCQREAYGHATRGYWKIVPDGSVSGGAELVSPVLRGEDGAHQVRVASEALRAAGAKVNKSTGLHVHHEVRDLTVAQFRALVRSWGAAQLATDQLVAPSRRGRANSFCLPLDSHDLSDVDRVQSMDLATARMALGATRSHNRYRTLNVRCYPLYGTVEVRQHQGTIEADKILAWVEFGQAFIAAAKNGATAEQAQTLSVVDLLDHLRTRGELKDETARYLERRATKLTRRAVYAR